MVASGPRATAARPVLQREGFLGDHIRSVALPVALSVGTGAMLHWCQPPGGSAALGWLALGPLYLAILGTANPGRAFALAFLSGVVFWALHVRWLLDLPGIHLGSFAVALPVLAALFGLVGPLAWLGRLAPAGVRWSVLASAWVAVEWLRMHVGFVSIPWGSLAYSQLESLPIAQVASVGGLYAVSFLAAGLAGGAAVAWHSWRRAAARERPGWEIGVPLLLLLLALLFGSVRLDGQAAPRNELRIAAVQAGVYVHGRDPRSQRRAVLERYELLSREAVAEGAELIAWPASSVPGSIPADRGLTFRLTQLARELSRPLLVGSAGQDKAEPGRRERPTANSAFLLDASGEVTHRYDKIQLLPFNEYLPLRGMVRWPGWLVGDFLDARAGDARTVFEAHGARFGVLICWENLFPAGFRATAAQDLHFLVSMTNEAFTTATAAHAQMLAMNTYRAIENGLPIVRVATTGTSGFIDAFGRLDAVVAGAGGSSLEATGFSLSRVPLDRSETLYQRLGDSWLGVAALWLGFVAWRASPLRGPTEDRQ